MTSLLFSGPLSDSPILQSASTMTKRRGIKTASRYVARLVVATSTTATIIFGHVPAVIAGPVVVVGAAHLDMAHSLEQSTLTIALDEPPPPDITGVLDRALREITKPAAFRSESYALAQNALDALAARTDEDLEDWVRLLAGDLSKADD